MNSPTHKVTIVVLPGSQWQVPLTEYLTDSGYRTLVVNPNADSPAFNFADGYLQSDIFDIETVENYCKYENAAAVISDECDIAMPVVAALGKQLGLHTLSPASARLFTDKYKMREFCEANGFDNPAYRICKSAEDVIQFQNDLLGAKIIVKPLDSNSSRGVHTVTNAAEARLTYKDTLSFSRIEQAVLAEQFITGTEFTVDGVKTPNKHFTLAISQKSHYAHNENIAKELYFSYCDPSFDYEALRHLNNTLMQATQLEFGLTHCEYKFMDGKYYLIEMAARGGGNLISSHIAPYMSGFDSYAYLIDSSLHGAKDIEFVLNENYKDRCAVLKFFDTPKGGGLVKEVKGEDFLRSCKNILAYAFNFKIGDSIENAVNDASRIGFYIAAGESELELRDIMQTVSDKVQIDCTLQGP